MDGFQYKCYRSHYMLYTSIDNYVVVEKEMEHKGGQSHDACIIAATEGEKARLEPRIGAALPLLEIEVQTFVDDRQMFLQTNIRNHVYYRYKHR